MSIHRIHGKPPVPESEFSKAQREASRNNPTRPTADDIEAMSPEERAAFLEETGLRVTQPTTDRPDAQPWDVDRLTRGRDLTDEEISHYLADRQGPIRHATARVGDEIAEKLRDRLAAVPGAWSGWTPPWVQADRPPEPFDPDTTPVEGDPDFDATSPDYRRHWVDAEGRRCNLIHPHDGTHSNRFGEWADRPPEPRSHVYDDPARWGERFDREMIEQAYATGFRSGASLATDKSSTAMIAEAKAYANRTATAGPLGTRRVQEAAHRSTPRSSDD